jgi:hypothetical protein
MWEDYKGCLLPIIIVVSVYVGAIIWKSQRDEKRAEVKIEEVSDPSKIDKYLIIDRRGCVHTEKCMNLRWYNDSTMYAVNYVDTFTVTQWHYDYVCIECVGTKEYEHLKRITKRNQRR